LKLLHGKRRGSRLNRQAPKPKGGKPAMPSGMSREARNVWRRQMRAMGGIFTSADTDCLRVYCEAAGRYRQAAEALAASRPLVRGRSGVIVKHPLHQIVRDDAMLVRLFGRELGFAPAAREGLVAAEDEEDPFGRWLSRPP
jgi:P27 family predicted phage terminase small subunit